MAGGIAAIDDQLEVDIGEFLLGPRLQRAEIASAQKGRGRLGRDQDGRGAARTRGLQCRFRRAPVSNENHGSGHQGSTSPRSAWGGVAVSALVIKRLR